MVERRPLIRIVKSLTLDSNGRKTEPRESFRFLGEDEQTKRKRLSFYFLVAVPDKLHCNLRLLAALFTPSNTVCVYTFNYVGSFRQLFRVCGCRRVYI